MTVKEFRTEKVNSAFRWIAELNSASGLKEKGQNGVDSILSNYVGMIGQDLNFFIHEIDNLENYRGYFIKQFNTCAAGFKIHSTKLLLLR